MIESDAAYVAQWLTAERGYEYAEPRHKSGGGPFDHYVRFGCSDIGPFHVFVTEEADRLPSARTMRDRQRGAAAASPLSETPLTLEDADAVIRALQAEVNACIGPITPSMTEAEKAAAFDRLSRNISALSYGEAA